MLVARKDQLVQPPARVIGAWPRFRGWFGAPTVTLVGGLFLVLLVVGGALALEAPGANVGAVLPVLFTSALYLAAGLIAWQRRPHNRIGVLMVLTGLSIWVTMLIHVPNQFLSAVGTVGATLPLSLTLHLLLAFPSGRVEGRLARILVGLGYAASTIFPLPVVLIGSGPAAVWNPDEATSIVWWAASLQTVVGVVSVVAAAGLIAVRAVRADPIERRLLGPMVWYRVLLPLLIAVGALAAQASDDVLLSGLTAVQFLGVLLLPVVFLLGLLFGSFGRTSEVDELVSRIGATTPAPGELTTAVAQALGDPEALVVYARTELDGYVDDAGRPVSDEAMRGRRVYPVQHNGRTVGGIVHHEGLGADPAQMEVLGGIVAMGIDGQRLAAEQRALLADLRDREAALYASRRRLLQAEDGERRRISRDLHDGAQQHIVLLGLTARQLSRNTADPDTAASAASIADGMTRLLTEFHDLIAGIMPAPLLERGLIPAVQLLTDQMPIPTTLTTRAPADRLPAEVESTVYFAVSEALTNVVKHAAATSAQVRIIREGGAGQNTLRVSVSDDGVGGVDLAGGTGLNGLVDRIVTLGGTLWVESTPGKGSVVHLEVPCA